MKYFGNEEKAVRVDIERKLEYLRCDRCHKKIEENRNASIDSEKAKMYFDVTITSYIHSDDIFDCFNSLDICKNCLFELIKEYLLDKHNTDYEFEIKTKWFEKCFEDYDEDKHYLVEEDGYAK